MVQRNPNPHPNPNPNPNPIPIPNPNPNPNPNGNRCLEKGSDATMTTITFLTPEHIPVVGVNCLGRCN